MKRVKKRGKKIRCKQCKRLLPRSYFAPPEKLKKYPEMEGFCGVCWSCP